MKTKGQKGMPDKQSEAPRSKKTNKDSKMEGKKAEDNKNLKEPVAGNNKGEEKNEQLRRLKSDARNSPDNPDKQESTNIRKKIHSSPGSDTEPMK